LIIALLLAAAVTGHPDGLPVKTPKAVGMSAERLATIDRVVRRGITAGGYPGAAVVVGRKGASIWQKGFGHLGWTADSPEVEADKSIYDLASLTKVVGTTTAAMILFDEHKIDLDEKVAHYLPAFTGGLKDEVTVRQLLMHRSGLPAGRELWRHAHSPEEAKQMVIDTPLEYRPGSGYVYSDIGADILGMVVEQASGKALDLYLQDRVFGPLGMNDTEFRPADSLVYRIAPTEVSPPRGYPVRGQVHDENAYVQGGVTGHAGLFGTASDLAIFAQMLLNGGTYGGVRIVADSTVRLFTTRAAGSRALGWEVADGQHGAGSYLSANAFGHTGFTGTSMWIDPDREMFVILLTNRVHAARARRPAKVIADVRADLADAAALAVTDANLAVAEMPTSFRADREVGWNRPLRTSKVRRFKGSSHNSSSAPTRGIKKSSVRTMRKSKVASTGKKKSATTTFHSKKRHSAGKALAKSATKAHTD
jgi:CubicO group peptidase (beta-lactamase class C family)